MLAIPSTAVNGIPVLPPRSNVYRVQLCLAPAAGRLYGCLSPSFDDVVEKTSRILVDTISDRTWLFVMEHATAVRPTLMIFL